MENKKTVGRPELYDGGFACIHRSIPAKMVPELNKWIEINKPKYLKQKETVSVAVEAVTPIISGKHLGSEHIKSPVIENEMVDFSGEKYLHIEKYTKFKSSDRPNSLIERISWDRRKKESDDKIRLAWEKYKEIN